MNQPINTDRRSVLKLLAASTAAPFIVPSRLFGADAPSNKITVGCIGVGWQGGSNLDGFLAIDDCRVVAICDVDEKHLKEAVDKVNARYGNQDCKGYKDFRELIARKDIDAVAISTPDHWHSIPAIMAANAGKDIFCEKPLSHKLSEGIAMVEAAQKNKIIWQTGSWQRSVAQLPLGRRTGPERLPRQGFPRRGRPAIRSRGLRRHRQGQTRWPGARRRGLRNVDRPRENDALQPLPFPQELALELQHRRRPAHGLDRPPLRHRPLGPRQSEIRLRPGRRRRPARSRRHRGLSRPERHLEHRAPNTASSANIPATSMSSSPVVIRRSRAAQNGSARTAGSASPAANSTPPTSNGSARSRSATRRATWKSNSTKAPAISASSSIPSSRASARSPRWKSPIARRRPATSVILPLLPAAN